VLYDANTLPEYLRQHGLVGADDDVAVTALTGGVSSAIHRVQSGEQDFVVKQALEKLRVKDDWYCDPKRNLYEQEFLAIAVELMPDAIPQLIWRDPENGLFIMEFLSGQWQNWKQLMLAGELQAAVATTAGCCLAKLHRETWRDAELAARFDNTPLFHELRISPYLLTSAERHPLLADWLRAESSRLAENKLALVHGDYSPKNLLTDGAAIKILDAEVAWFGDPAFDSAFQLNHLYLKALHAKDRASGFAELREAFRSAYIEGMGEHWDAAYDERVARLLLMLMLARVSSKSPVEYLAPGGPEAQWVIAFVTEQHAKKLCVAELEQLFRQHWA